MFSRKQFLDNFRSEGGEERIDEQFSAPLEEVFIRVKRDFPLKSYLIREKLDEQLGIHAELIYNIIEPGYRYSEALYSYITFHQIYFHLKNYLMKLKGLQNGYRGEFLDIFQDIFLDNFLIFRELDKYLGEEYARYLNIWLDGFFLNIFNRIVGKAPQGSSRIQPDLFFVTILFLSLPEISKHFEEIPFTSLIHFHEPTSRNWKKGLSYLKDIDFHTPTSNRSLNSVFLFTLTFLNLNLSFGTNGELYFDEENTIRCVEFLNLLIGKTDELVDNIKKIRQNLLDAGV